jgi:hypothetical protein
MARKPWGVKCSGTNNRGGPCGNWAVRGATVCESHGAGAPQVASKAHIRAELHDWGITNAREMSGYGLSPGLLVGGHVE